MKDHCCTLMQELILEPGCAIKYDPVFREYYMQTAVPGKSLIELYKNFQFRDENDHLHTYENSGKDFFVHFLNFCFYYDKKGDVLKYNGIHTIDHCPFCGKKLPNELSDEWFYAIDMEYGYEYIPGYKEKWENGEIDRSCNPPPQPLPEEFNSDRWWKRRHLNTEYGWNIWVKKVNKWLDVNPNSEAWWGRKYDDK